MKKILGRGLLALALCAAMTDARAQAETEVKFKLASPESGMEFEGSAKLNGESLSGHVASNGSDFTLSGVVKNDSVTVEVAGKIVSTCTKPNQSMSGTGSNDSGATVIDLNLDCGSGYSERSYSFHLYLPLPKH